MEADQELLALAARILLGLVFLRASVAKLVANDDFRDTVANYEILPSRLVAPVARWVPRVELAAAVALLVGIGVRPAAALVAALLGTFAAAISVNLLRGRRIDCGCHSSTVPERIGWELVGRDAVLAATALFVALREPVVLSLEAVVRSDAPATGGFSDAGAILIATTVGYLACLIGGQALSLRRSMATFRASKSAS
jgi:uncharacterized membrane protein YphA (DoxX/SURF4 family)